MGEIELLAERVEGLGGPDREVDVLIALAIDWGHPASPCTLRHLHKALGASLAELVRDAESPQMITSQLPRFTASIDSALSLVPEGHQCSIGNSPIAWWAHVGPLNDPNSDETAYTGATPALALCAAALRARASITRTTGDGDGNG